MATKSYSYIVISETTVKVLVEVASNGNIDCAGWYVRNNEIVGHVWEDQPNYKLANHAIVTAMSLLEPTTSQGDDIMNNSNENNATNFSPSKVDNILKSFDKAQGNTVLIPEKLYFRDSLTIDYLNSTYQLEFQSEEHLKAYFLMLFYRDIKDRSVENIDKLFNHINSGAFLSLNHTDGTGSTVSVDKYAIHKPLFISLGITECRSNGKGSKLVQLLIDNPNEFTVTALVNEGFNNISPLLDGFKVIGLKCELPKIVD